MCEDYRASASIDLGYDAADIKAGKSEIQVSHRPGFTGGGGAFGLLGLSGLALAALFLVRRRLSVGN